MPHPTQQVAVRHPISGAFVALDPGVDYADDDDLVEAYGWAFAPIVDAHEIVTSVELDKPKKPAQRRK